MEWIWDAANSLGVAVLAVWAWFGFKYLGDENEQRKANIRKAQSVANDAKVNSLEAKREARQTKNLVNDRQIVIGGHLPETPHNESLVEALRKAAARVSAKRAHPAGAGRVPGMRRSAVTGRYVTNPVQTTPSGIDYIPVAAAIALTTDTSSSYSDSSSSSSSYDSGSSSSSSDSGSFGGGDSGSF